ncbi:MAG: DUF3808 domain-containing protein [Marinicaulis sp.]|nr:DUF3808 domain-containing protein [Marinicaulis sp.]
MSNFSACTREFKRLVAASIVAATFWSVNGVYAAPIIFDEEETEIMDLGASQVLYDLQEMMTSPELSPVITGAVRQDLIAAIASFAAGRFDRAENFAKKVTSAAPDAGEGWQILGLALANKGEFEDALEALDKANAIYTQNPSLFVVQGDIFIVLGRKDDASVAYAAAIEREPTYWVAHEKAGDLYLHDGKLDDALDSFQEASRHAPNDEITPYQKLVSTLIKAGRNQAALAAANEFVQAAPDNAAALISLAQAQIGAGEMETGRATLESAAETDPRDPKPLLALAVIHRVNGEQFAERDVLDRALVNDPENVAALRRLAGLEVLEGRNEKAQELFEKAESLASKNSLGAKPQLAELYLAAGRTKAAIELLSHWKDAPANSPEAALATLARAYAADGRIVAATKIHKARIEQHGTLTASLDYAAFLRGNLDFSGAEKVLIEAQKAHPESAAPWLHLGRTYGAEKRYDAALEAFEAGLKISPNSREFESAALLSEIRMENFDAAFTRASRLASLENSSAIDYFWLASVEQSRGRNAEAITAYETAREMDPDNWIVANNLAALLIDSDPERALSLATDAAEKSGGNLDARDTLGWAHYNNQNFAEAQSIFTTLTEENPDNAKAHFRLGQTLAKIGDTTGARKALSKAVALDPDHADAAAALAALASE